MNIKTPYKTFMIASLLLAFISLAAWGILAYKSYGLKGDIAALSVQAKDTAKNDAKVLSLKAALRESRPSMAEIESRFVTKDGIPAFIDLLEAKARTANVKVDVGSIDLAGSGDSQAIEPLRIHVSGMGAWKDCVGYASLLEALPFAVKLEGVSLSKSNGAWNLSLDLVALVIPNPTIQ